MIPAPDVAREIFDRLHSIEGLSLQVNAPLKNFTRFGLGGPAKYFAEASTTDAFLAARAVADRYQMPVYMMGGGSNLIVADRGFAGMMLRYTDARIVVNGGEIRCSAGAVLQDLVDASIAAGLAGLHTMTRIPGWVGGAVYGNAGAYGHSIHEFVEDVTFLAGDSVQTLDRAGCEFAYRESRFKRHKDWTILSVHLRLPVGDRDALASESNRIQQIRDAKYPPSMKCAGSIFKNFLLRELPEQVAAALPAKVVIEGKVPSAYFLEQVGAKGMRRGDIQVATYHANLIYNDGNGTAADLRSVIDELKRRVLERFGIHVCEEVQYVGF